MTPRWPPLPRRLARTPPPLRWETYNSYLGRLAAANRVSFDDLDEIAHLYDGDPAALDQLAALTGHRPAALRHAIPELFHHPALGTASLHGGCPTPREYINDIRPPCRRCAATAGADPGIAEVWATHDLNVCLRHQIWTGDGNNHPRHQIDLGPHPGIVHAQIRHQRILRRHGRLATHAAFRTAQGLWADLSTTPGYAWQRDTRTARMHPPDGAAEPSQAMTQAAAYPETVAFTAMLASPHWRTIALTRTPAGNQRFHHEFRRRVAPSHHQDLYPRFLFWLRRDLEWHPGQDNETSPPAAQP